MSGDFVVNHGDDHIPSPDLTVAKRQTLVHRKAIIQVFENQCTNSMVTGVPVRLIPNIDSVRPPPTLVAGCPDNQKVFETRK
jgi:hypothetical protein